MKVNGHTQITMQVPDEMFEDIKVIAHRRGQTMSEFIRRTLTAEMVEEANREVLD